MVQPLPRRVVLAAAAAVVSAAKPELVPPFRVIVLVEYVVVPFEPFNDARATRIFSTLACVRFAVEQVKFPLTLFSVPFVGSVTFANAVQAVNDIAPAT